MKSKIKILILFIFNFMEKWNLTDNEQDVIILELRNVIFEYEKKYIELLKDKSFEQTDFQDFMTMLRYYKQRVKELLVILKKINLEIYQLTFDKLEKELKT